MSVDNIYSVLDKAKNSYTAPFCATTDDEAKRFMVQQINVDSTSFFALYPDSFELYRFGTFDHSNGKITPYKCGERCFSSKRLGTFRDILEEFKNYGSNNNKKSNSNE